MAYIITSKTRSRIMSQPKERAKLMSDRRQTTIERHGVHNVTPVNGMDELDVHKNLDEQGEGIKESMEATSEFNAQKRKAKEKAQAGLKQKVIQERVKKLEKRDRDNGTATKAAKYREAKRRKK